MDDARPFLVHAVSVGVKLYCSGGAHMVHPARGVAHAQVVADGVEVVVLLEGAAVVGHALQHPVHGARRRVRQPEALRQAVLLLPAAPAQVGARQVQVVGHQVLWVNGVNASSTAVLGCIIYEDGRTLFYK